MPVFTEGVNLLTALYLQNPELDGSLSFAYALDRPNQHNLRSFDVKEILASLKSFLL